MAIGIGQLLVCEEYFLLIYSSAGLAMAAAKHGQTHGTSVVGVDDEASAYGVASFWEHHQGAPVTYCEPNKVLLVLKQEEQCLQVLAGDKVGWINNQDWLNLKEMCDD